MRPLLLSIALAVAALAAASPAGSTTATSAPEAPIPDAVPGEVIVGFEDGMTRADRAELNEESGVGRGQALGPDAEQLDVLDGQSVAHTVAELRTRPGVTYAVPNYTTQVAGYIPDDPGRRRGAPGDWRKLQWNFAGPAGVNAPDAWSAARERGAAGGRGATVAVLDSGAAYLDRGRYRRAPDLSGRRWVDGRDFVDGDRKAYDENYDGDRKPNYGMGHGTHVASTIREATDNGRAVTGLAYGVRVMPVRVLDVNGFGDTASLVRAIRYAARHDADVINVSLQVNSAASASASGPFADAVGYARRRGTAIVAAAGNHRAGQSEDAGPLARLDEVIAVGATTESRCLAEYSNTGKEVDIAAPGGGDDASPGANPQDLASCRPDESGRSVYQETWDCSADRRRPCRSFGLLKRTGTSMASPHVAAAAALLVASEGLGPEAVQQRLEASARDLGPPGRDNRYGAGLLDAAAALAG